METSSTARMMRRLVLFGFGAAATVLGLSSAAWACSIFDPTATHQAYATNGGPQVGANPASGPAGSVTRVEGSNFNGAVNLYWNTAGGAPLASVADGSDFVVSVTIPNVAPGDFHILAVGHTAAGVAAERDVPFQVVNAVTSAGGGDPTAPAQVAPAKNAATSVATPDAGPAPFTPPAHRPTNPVTQTGGSTGSPTVGSPTNGVTGPATDPVMSGPSVGVPASNIGGGGSAGATPIGGNPGGSSSPGGNLPVSNPNPGNPSSVNPIPGNPNPGNPSSVNPISGPNGLGNPPSGGGQLGSNPLGSDGPPAASPPSGPSEGATPSGASGNQPNLQGSGSASGAVLQHGPAAAKPAQIDDALAVAGVPEAPRPADLRTVSANLWSGLNGGRLHPVPRLTGGTGATASPWSAATNPALVAAATAALMAGFGLAEVRRRRVLVRARASSTRSAD